MYIFIYIYIYVYIYMYKYIHIYIYIYIYIYIDMHQFICMINPFLDGWMNVCKNGWMDTLYT